MKHLHVRLPEKTYEDFIRAFPGFNQRTTLIRGFVKWAAANSEKAVNLVFTTFYHQQRDEDEELD